MRAHPRGALSPSHSASAPSSSMLNGEHNIHRGVFAVLTLVIGWGFTATGIYAWRQRPE